MKTGIPSAHSPDKLVFGYYRAPRSRVLLREPEVCMECNRVFISLYALRSCREHEGLDEI